MKDAAVKAVPGVSGGLTLSQLQRAHVERQDEWCPDQKPDLSFRGNEMAGEVGEACNVIKKLERERHGWRGSRATKEQLAEELADVVHTAALCAITAGIELEPAVVAKFNATSEKNGLASRIALSAALPLASVEQVMPTAEQAREQLRDVVQRNPDDFAEPYEQAGRSSAEPVVINGSPIATFVQGYQFDASDEGIVHTPTLAEQCMIEDAICSFISDPDLLKAALAHPCAGQPAAVADEALRRRIFDFICNDVLPSYDIASEVGRNDPELVDAIRTVFADAAVAHPGAGQPAGVAGDERAIRIRYTNYRGETSDRIITPRRIWWGSTEWHSEAQWLLSAFDHGKQADRDFTLLDMAFVGFAATLVPSGNDLRAVKPEDAT